MSNLFIKTMANEAAEEEKNLTLTFKNVPKFIEDFEVLYLNKKFSDVILNVGGEQLHAHKVILAARSEYFGKLLESENFSQVEIFIDDTSPTAFKALLKYIYTGIMALEPPNTNSILQMLPLVRKYSLSKLEIEISDRLEDLIDVTNIGLLLNIAKEYNMYDLKEACYTFSSINADAIVDSDSFSELTESSVVDLLQRDSFYVSEIKIFHALVKWCKANNKNLTVLNCLRLSSLTVVDIVSIVWPSGLYDAEELLAAIAEIVEVRPKKKRDRGEFLLDMDVASSLNKSEVMSGKNKSYLLNGNRNINNYTSHVIGETNGITIKLGTLCFVNHIYMMLWDEDDRHYSYYIEISIDGKMWKKVIDYSKFACRSYQRLYFQKEVVQYVRVVGTHNTANTVFHLIFLEAYYKNDIPKVKDGIICPVENVATPEKQALVIDGSNPNVLLDGNMVYDDFNGHTNHLIDSGKITVQLAQPYMISNMKLLLWDNDDRHYKYYVKTSTNKNDWETVVDRRNEKCKSWQTLKFEEKPVVFISIIGTFNSANPGFHCVHFECPASV